MRQYKSSVKSCQYYKEKKNRQFTALFKVSAFDAFQKIAYMKQVSTNSLLGELVDQYNAENADLIAQYDKQYAED